MQATTHVRLSPYMPKLKVSVRAHTNNLILNAEIPNKPGDKDDTSGLDVTVHFVNIPMDVQDLVDRLNEALQNIKWS